MIVTNVNFMVTFFWHTFNLKYPADKTNVTLYFRDLLRCYILYSVLYYSVLFLNTLLAYHVNPTNHLFDYRNDFAQWFNVEINIAKE